MNQFDDVIKIRVYGVSEQIFQDVYGYLMYNHINPMLYRTIDVVIKMPLYLVPGDILTDVTESLRSQQIFEDIDDLRYTLSPEISPIKEIKNVRYDKGSGIILNW